MGENSQNLAKLQPFYRRFLVATDPIGILSYMLHAWLMRTCHKWDALESLNLWSLRCRTCDATWCADVHGLTADRASRQQSTRIFSTLPLLYHYFTITSMTWQRHSLSRLHAHLAAIRLADQTFSTLLYFSLSISPRPIGRQPCSTTSNISGC